MRRAMLSWVVVLAALVAAACGGGSSPSSPSGSVAIQGVVLSGSASAELTASAGVKAAGGTVTVTVEGTGITTTVSANGTFELEGVPSGTFTLVFKKDGVEIGRVEITAAAGAAVKITVQIQSTTQSTTLIVVEIKIDDKDSTGTSTTPAAACVISGGKVGSGIELEGNAGAVTLPTFKMTVNGERGGTGLVEVKAASASFKCNGSPKATETECKATLKTGSKVHVSGTLDTCDPTAATVTATEVMIQKD